MTKMTRREALTLAISALTDNTEATAVLTKMVEQLDAKSNAPRKMTKEQVENLAHKENIFKVVSEAEAPVACKVVAEAVGLTSPKVSALLTQLVNDGRLNRAYEKRTALYSVKEDAVEA